MQDAIVLQADRAGSVRMLHEAAGGPILLRLVGGLVHDVWQWQGNAGVDWEGGVETDWYIQREKVRADNVPGTTTLQEEAVYRNCLAMCHWRNQEKMDIRVHGANKVTGAYRAEPALRLEVELFDSMRAAYDFQRYLGQPFKDQADDDALGEMSIGHASFFASRNRLNSAQSVTSYWDNARPIIPNCQTAVGDDLVTRRCSIVGVSASSQNHAWNSQDNFRVHDLAWHHKTTNTVQFQDKISIDARLNPSQGPALTFGMDSYDSMNRLMAQNLGAQTTNVVYAAIDWSTPIQPAIGMHYQEAT